MCKENNMNTELMEEYFTQIKSHNLFKEMSDDEIEYVFRNFEFKIKTFDVGDVILKNDKTQKFSLFILSGCARWEICGFEGSREILGNVNCGTLAYFVSPSTAGVTINSDLVACKETTVLYMDFSDFMKDDYKFITVQHKLLCNIAVLLDENLRICFEHKIILSERSTRKKICRFLDFIKKNTKSNSFDIDFSRSELADYLSIDKSSLSRELGNMKKEGIIEFCGNHFEIKMELC